jgi:hypothetical protein
MIQNESKPIDSIIKRLSTELLNYVVDFLDQTKEHTKDTKNAKKSKGTKNEDKFFNSDFGSIRTVIPHEMLSITPRNEPMKLFIGLDTRAERNDFGKMPKKYREKLHQLQKYLNVINNVKITNQDYPNGYDLSIGYFDREQDLLLAMEIFYKIGRKVKTLQIKSENIPICVHDFVKLFPNVHEVIWKDNTIYTISRNYDLQCMFKFPNLRAMDISGTVIKPMHNYMGGDFISELRDKKFIELLEIKSLNIESLNIVDVSGFNPNFLETFSDTLLNLEMSIDSDSEQVLPRLCTLKKLKHLTIYHHEVLIRGFVTRRDEYELFSDEIDSLKQNGCIVEYKMHNEKIASYIEINEHHHDDIYANVLVIRRINELYVEQRAYFFEDLKNHMVAPYTFSSEHVEHILFKNGSGRYIRQLLKSYHLEKKNDEIQKHKIHKHNIYEHNIYKHNMYKHNIQKQRFDKQPKTNNKRYMHRRLH